jgi:putative protease
VSRVILARELSLNQIAEIRAKTKIELEVFIHGALCVSYSGNCYMSYAATKRSANRGACSQPCRLPYALIENDGKIIAKEKHLLSLLDLNIGSALPDLINAGVTSFKIEGRLKDSVYVKNITAFYHALLNNFIEQNQNFYRPSKGSCAISFKPDTERTFSRGYSTYFIYNRPRRLANPATPKSMGKYAGTVTKTDSKHFLLNTEIILTNGDGICFISDGRLIGTQINGKDGKGFIPQDITGITIGTEIFCNRDTEFIKQIEKSEIPRSRSLVIDISGADGILEIAADTEGFKSSFTFSIEADAADNQQRASEIWKTQMSKSGQSAFNVSQININTSKLPHYPVSKINELRRVFLDKLALEILKDAYNARPVSKINVADYPEKHIDYQHNVSNGFARMFYEKRNVEVTEPAIEMDISKAGEIQVMSTRYCILFELGMCLNENGKHKLKLPLYIVNGNKKYTVEFNCESCEMKIKMNSRRIFNVLKFD